jgi:hypothetical protein
VNCGALLVLLLVGCGRYQFESHDAAQRSDSDIDAVDDASPDANGAMPCPVTFCGDFTGGPIVTGWDNQLVMNGASATEQGGALVVTLPATGAELFLEKQLPAPTTSIEIKVRMRYSTTNAGTDCELDLVALNWQMGTCGLPFGYYFVRDGTGPFNLQETNGNTSCANRQNYDINRDSSGPHDYRMLITLGAAGVARVRLDIDQTMVVDHPAAQMVPSSTLLFRLGGVAIRNAAAPWTIEYESLQIDVQ